MKRRFLSIRDKKKQTRHAHVHVKHSLTRTPLSSSHPVAQFLHRPGVVGRRESLQKNTKNNPTRQPSCKRLGDYNRHLRALDV